MFGSDDCDGSVNGIHSFINNCIAIPGINIFGRLRYYRNTQMTASEIGQTLGQKILRIYKKGKRVYADWVICYPFNPNFSSLFLASFIDCLLIFHFINLYEADEGDKKYRPKNNSRKPESFHTTNYT